MKIPELIPFVFVGRDLDPGEQKHYLYFQDVRSYYSGARWGDVLEELSGGTEEDRFEQYLLRPHFERYEENQIAVLDFEKAVNLFLICEKNRLEKLK